jgi:predicted TIM-barrel fold metal-dependent hydrolase
MGDRRIIDAHNHPDWHGHDLQGMLANMDRYGISKTWLLSWEAPPSEYSPGMYGRSTHGALFGCGAGGPIGFARCLSYSERAPNRFVLGHAPDPRLPDAVDRLAAAIDIYGVRVCGEVKLRAMYDNPDFLRLFRFCGERELPVVVHIDYPLPCGVEHPRPDYWYGGGIEAFERALRECPKTTFLGHAPGFWSHISGDGKHAEQAYPEGPVVAGGRVPELMRACPNLYGDLSAGSALNALRRDREFGREFVLEFQDRLVFGRDSFDNRHVEYLESLELPGPVLDKILFENAQRLVPDEVE